MLEQTGFTDVAIGHPVDTFGGADGEGNARAFEVHGYAFLARKPAEPPAARMGDDT
jgi:hypothetical protein